MKMQLEIEYIYAVRASGVFDGLLTLINRCADSRYYVCCPGLKNEGADLQKKFNIYFCCDQHI